VQQESIPIVARAEQHLRRVAVIDGPIRLTYEALLERSRRAAGHLLGGAPDLNGARVAFLAPPGVEYVVVQWAIWRAGGIAVPLCTTHPAPELEYVIDDSDAAIVVAHPEFSALLAPLAQRRGLVWLATDALDADTATELPRVGAQRGAMLLYTSGTTGRPKGVLSTHAIVTAQIESIVAAWEWSAADRVLHVLPLHHLHGILNLLCCALWSGACCEFIPRFDAQRVWRRIGAVASATATPSDALTLFMAVPAIYAKLAQAFDQAEPAERERWTAGCQRLRLMVSGSAALPATMLERWRSISGHILLERYGMTEFGMALGNPLHGERRPGSVGVPFPSVEVRLRDEGSRPVPEGAAGELQIRSPGVFAEYWRRPQASADAFTPDGWFRTGDVAVLEAGAYRILGRQSVDILKTGGFKVSALEIEEVLREHPAVAECAVVGVADEVWGQRVAAAVVLHEGARLDIEALRAWGKQRLAPYKVPSLLRALPELPKNALGKVQKTQLTALFCDRD
jgi:malonyl-CoA/methylmalonyl-CoA synthetase